MKGHVTRFAYLMALLAVCGFAVVTLPRELHSLHERQEQIRQVEQRNASLAKEVERKRERIRRLSDNPSEQELEIRDRLKMVGPKDRVYVIGEPDKDAPAGDRTSK